jgi:hypothetical protein
MLVAMAAPTIAMVTLKFLTYLLITPMFGRVLAVTLAIRQQTISYMLVLIR